MERMEERETRDMGQSTEGQPPDAEPLRQHDKGPRYFPSRITNKDNKMDGIIVKKFIS